MRLFLVSSSPDKASDILKIFREFGIEVKWINFKVPEIQDSDVKAIVKQKAKFCSERFKRPVVVADAGLFIDALKGFPGTMVKFVLDTIGNKGILKLMERKRDRGAKFIEAIGYCKPNSRPKAFVGITKGEITQTLQGRKGFGFDPIFRPLGYSSTYGQNPALRLRTTPLREAIKKFVTFLKK